MTSPSREAFEACKKAAIEEINFESWLWKRVTEDRAYHTAFGVLR